MLEWMKWVGHKNFNFFWSRYRTLPIYKFQLVEYSTHHELTQNGNFREQWFIIAYKLNTNIQLHIPKQ